jgi:hypothetical protein
MILNIHFIETVNAMHDSCRHRKARYINYDSPWCAVFTDDDLKVK